MKAEPMKLKAKDAIRVFFDLQTEGDKRVAHLAEHVLLGCLRLDFPEKFKAKVAPVFKPKLDAMLSKVEASLAKINEAVDKDGLPKEYADKFKAELADPVRLKAGTLCSAFNFSARTLETVDDDEGAGRKTVTDLMEFFDSVREEDAPLSTTVMMSLKAVVGYDGSTQAVSVDQAGNPVDRKTLTKYVVQSFSPAFASWKAFICELADGYGVPVSKDDVGAVIALTQMSDVGNKGVWEFDFPSELANAAVSWMVPDLKDEDDRLASGSVSSMFEERESLPEVPQSVKDEFKRRVKAGDVDMDSLLDMPELKDFVEKSRSIFASFFGDPSKNWKQLGRCYDRVAVSESGSVGLKMFKVDRDGE